MNQASDPPSKRLKLAVATMKVMESKTTGKSTGQEMSPEEEQESLIKSLAAAVTTEKPSERAEEVVKVSAVQPSTQNQNDTSRMSLTDFPEELLLLMFQYCASDAATICALDAASCTTRSLTATYWSQLSERDFGSGRAGKRSYMAGRALTVRPPTRFRLEHEPLLSGSNRYTSRLAASNSLIVMGVHPHSENRERLDNMPISILKATTLKPLSCWPILHEPCQRVAVVASDIVVMQTTDNVLWACHGCVKVKVLLPSEDGCIRAVAGSKGGLAVVQEAKLCLYKPSIHATLALYQTLELDQRQIGGATSRLSCAMSWSTCGKYLALAGLNNVNVYTWGSGDAVLEQLVTFPHSIRHYYDGKIAVSEKYVCLTKALRENDDGVRVFSSQDGTLLRCIPTTKALTHWSGAYNAHLYVSIVAHFIMVTTTRGVGLALFDVRTGELVRELPSSLDYELHDMVQLPSMTSLSFMVSFNGGNQMVWGFEGCQELL